MDDLFGQAVGDRLVGSQESVAPESVTKVGDTITIVSKTFKPPGPAAPPEWCFKKFATPIPWKHVDIETDPAGLPATVNPDETTEIKITVANVPETAAMYPLKSEGNLNRTGGQSGRSGQSGFLPAHWSVKMETVRVDLDTDSNNNGTIEDEEDAYENEKGLSGRVVCLNRAGDGPGLEHVAEIKLAVENASEGTVTLREIGTPKRLRAWADAGCTQEVNLLTVSWAPAEVPSQLWIDGTAIGQATLRLSLERSGKETVADEVEIYVADTISYSPRGNTLYVYEPYLSTGGSDAIRDHLKSHGWPLGNLKRYVGMVACTLVRLKEPGDLALRIGIVAYHSFGWHAEQHRDTVEVARGTEAEMNAWKGNEPNMYVALSEVAIGPPYPPYAVKAKAAWFQNNWKAKLDANRAIVVMMGCNTYPEITAAVGGRSAFGYEGLVLPAAHEPNMNLLFGRLTGQRDGAINRTTGKAWEAGGFVTGYPVTESKFWLYLGTPANPNFMAGWTTLNPATHKAFPSFGVETKGAGCIIFDSYMDDDGDDQNPNLAVRVDRGAGVSARRWFTNSDDPRRAYGVSFDFPKHGKGSITTRAEADNCLNWEIVADPPHPQRRLSGDRVQYGSDKAWSF